MNKTFGLGPNKYPQHVQDPARFKYTIDTYHALMRNLAEDIVRALCKALGVEDSWMPYFTETPIATLRLLHYPPQPPNSSDLERGKPPTVATSSPIANSPPRDRRPHRLWRHHHPSPRPSRRPASPRPRNFLLGRCLADEKRARCESGESHDALDE